MKSKATAQLQSEQLYKQDWAMLFLPALVLETLY